MTAPAVEAQRLLWSLGLGAGLGGVYGLLRFFRPRWLGDLIFVLGAFYSWLYLSFALCRGDIRLACTLGLLVGGLVEELTLGRLLRPVFQGFWRGIWKILGIFLLPVKKIWIIFKKIYNLLLAGAKKWVTIVRNHVRRKSPGTGGVTHGRKKTRIHSSAQEQSLDHCGGDCGHRTVYGSTGGPAGGRKPRGRGK